MKTLLGNDVLSLLVRFFLGGVFVVASIEKIADPAAFVVSIDNYKILPDFIAILSATTLPWIELLCGFALIFGTSLRGSSLLAGLLLVMFTAAIISGLARGLDISCGCFTQDPDVAKIGWMKVVENLGLIILSVYAYAASGLRFTIEHAIRSTGPES